MRAPRSRPHMRRFRREPSLAALNSISGILGFPQELDHGERGHEAAGQAHSRKVPVVEVHGEVRVFHLEPAATIEVHVLCVVEVREAGDASLGVRSHNPQSLGHF